MARRNKKALHIDYWPGFIDALLGVVLVLIFLLTIFILTQTSLVSVVNSKESALGQLTMQLKQLERALSLSRNEASSLKTKLASTEEELSQTSSSLVSTIGKLAQSQSSLFGTQSELKETEGDLKDTQGDLTQRLEELDTAKGKASLQKDVIAANAEKIRKLTATISEYLDQVKLLNQQLGSSQKEVEERDASLGELNLKALDLNKQIKALSKQLGQANVQVRTQKLELGKLLAEIQRRDKEIERLQSFEKFRSEFLEKLAIVFEDQEDIHVVGDRFVFQGEVIFASGSAELTVEGKAKLNKLYQIYKSLETKIPPDINLNIQIQGHTDSDPISTSRYPTNWELSTARAVRVVRHLSLLGIPQNRMSAAGFGEFFPAISDDTIRAKRKNRRIEILFTRR